MRKWVLASGLALSICAVIAAWMVFGGRTANESAGENGARQGKDVPDDDNDPLGIGAHAKSFSRTDDYTAKDELIRRLVGYSALEEVSLRGCSALSDQGLRELGALTKLRKLDLHKSGAGGESLKAFSNLHELEELDLSLCDNVNDTGILAVGTLPKLRVLRLSGCTQLTDISLAHIASLPSLEVLDLSWCPRFTRTGLAELALLPLLRELSLANTPISDDTLAGLRLGSALKVLDLRQTPLLSQGAITRLREDNPDCRVLR